MASRERRRPIVRIQRNLLVNETDPYVVSLFALRYIRAWVSMAREQGLIQKSTEPDVDNIFIECYTSTFECAIER
jgi:hypothetical protein